MTVLSSLNDIIKRIYSLGKKIFIVVIVLAVIITIFIRTISKERLQVSNNAILSNRIELYKQLNNPEFKKTASGRLSLLLFKMTTCTFIGEACTDNPNDGERNYNSSVFGVMSKLMIAPYQHPPASGVYWAYSKLQESGFVPKTYAAEGIGFASIKPIMNLWIVFRDVAYLLLVLVLVVIGFMIMFRMKINPQTVISAENALPKIVTSLILITFSFAIAGFLIDAMYVLMVVGISLISNNGAYYAPGELQNKYIAGDMGTIYMSLFPIKNMDGFSQLLMTGDAIMGILPGAINGMIRIIAGAALIYAAFTPLLHTPQATGLGKVLDNINILGTSLGDIPNPIISTVLILIIYGLLGPLLLVHGAGLILGVLVWFTIIFLMFRIFFILFRAYLQVLILIIFSPLILLLEAVPGKSSFTYWLKNIFAELMCFPIVAVILSLAYVLTSTLSYPGDFWTPPFLTGIDPNAFAVILGMGLMFLIPDIIKLAKDALGVKPLPLNIGPQTFFAGAGAAVGGGTGILSQFGSIKLGLGAFGIGQGSGFMGLKKSSPDLTSANIGKAVAEALKTPTTEVPKGDS